MKKDEKKSKVKSSKEDKKKMKKYDQVYESVYSSEKKLNKCKLEKVTTDIGLNGGEYVKAMKSVVVTFENSIFENLIKYLWLSRRFHYGGTRRKRYWSNGFYLDAAYGVFMKHFIGTDKSLFSGRVIFRIMSYFDDFFPEFNSMNPFVDKMVFPYKHITLSYLSVISQMNERLELLDYAERNKLKFSEFLDYIINYVACVNDELLDNKKKKLYKIWFFAPNMMAVKLLGNKKREKFFNI